MSPTSGGLWKGGLTNIPSSPQSIVGRMLPVQANPERYWSSVKFPAGSSVRDWTVFDLTAVATMASEVVVEVVRWDLLGWAAPLATGNLAAGGAIFSDAR